MRRSTMRMAPSGGRPARHTAVPVALLLAASCAAPAAACSVCYGVSDGSPLVDGARLGVFFLLGVTVAVLGAFARFFLYLRQRARQSESDGIASEWADLQRSPPPC